MGVEIFDNNNNLVTPPGFIGSPDQQIADASGNIINPAEQETLESIEAKDFATELTLSGIKSQTDQLVFDSGRLVVDGSSVVQPVNTPGVVSVGNSSVSPLGASETFTGIFEDVKDYAMITVSVISDQASAIDGLAFQWSSDGTNIDRTEESGVSGVNLGRAFSLSVRARYFRVAYTNGTTPQTFFRLGTVYHVAGNGLITRPLKREVTDDNFSLLTSSVLLGFDSDAQMYEKVRTLSGSLDTKVSNSSDNPIPVISVPGTRTYVVQRFINAALPATLTSGNAGPYTVGNTTFSLSVGGSPKSYMFPTRAATAGTSISGFNPATANGGAEKIRVSINGGPVKEVKIGKNLTSANAIAASLQARIRAEVVNGTGVTVDFNITKIGRYTVTSGTAGSSSRVVFTTGGDNLAVILKLGLANGGTEISGTAANSYHTSEVVTLLSENLSGLKISSTSDNKLYFETIDIGTSAAIQVTAGGSNTAFNFSTALVTGSDGTGSNELNVNGATTNVRFSLVPTAGKSLTITEFIFRVRQDGATLQRFGGLTELTNGVLVEFRTNEQPTVEFFAAKTNAELIAFSSDGQIMIDAYNDNTDLVVARFTLNPGIKLNADSTDNIFITVRDNLSSLTSFRVQARGWIE
jgi:hypothetical protein